MTSKKGFGESNTPKKKDSFRYVHQSTLNKWMKKASKGNVKYQMKYTNYFRSVWNHASQEPDSTMIHERDYEPMKCCICGAEMNSIHNTHNPYPITPFCTAKKAHDENLPHRCCTKCDHSVVIPERIKRKSAENPNSDFVMASPVFDFFNQGFNSDEGYEFVG